MMARKTNAAIRVAQEVDDGPTKEALTHSSIRAVPPPRNTNMPTVCRVEGMHVRLDLADKITPAEYDWVERYALDCEIEQGASAGKPETESHEPSEWSRLDTQVSAQARLRRAREQMKKSSVADARAIIESACVKAHRICDVAIVCGFLPKDDETIVSFTGRVAKRVENRVSKAIAAAFLVKV